MSSHGRPSLGVFFCTVTLLQLHEHMMEYRYMEHFETTQRPCMSKSGSMYRTRERGSVERIGR
eukprot:8763149-Pyramimonas_sp.AAC.2